MHKPAHLFQMFHFIQYVTVQLRLNCKVMTVALTLTVNKYYIKVNFDFYVWFIEFRADPFF